MTFILFSRLAGAASAVAVLCTRVLDGRIIVGEVKPNAVIEK